MRHRGRRARSDAAANNQLWGGTSKEAKPQPVAMILQPFNPYVSDPNVCKYTGVGRYNVERKNARRHALKKHESMKDHIGLLAKEVGDAASPVNTERAHKFFKDSMRPSSELWTFSQIKNTIASCSASKDDFFVILDIL